MFSKAFISPKSSTQKSFSHLSPTGKDYSLIRSTTTSKAKSPSTSQYFDQKESFYAKENIQCGNESLISTQMGSTSHIASDPASSMIFVNNGAEGREGVANLYNEKYCRKVLEEMAILRRELDQKNGLVERLMKENGTLRREMEEFVTAVDDAREYIDAELKECNQRIVVLETEIHEVRQENKQYKEEFERRKTTVKEVQKTKEIEQEADGFYSTAQRNMEDFYFKLNEQLTDFMCTTQKQHQDFNKSLHKRVQDTTTSNDKETTGKVEQAKSNMSLPNYSTPLRTVKQNTNLTKNFFEAAKSPKGTYTTPVMKKNCPKQNLDHFLSNTVEATSPSSYSLCNTSPGYTSMTHFEDPVSSVLSDYSKSTKKDLLLSPSKSGMLRTKLKSDAILQEMKKRLSGV